MSRASNAPRIRPLRPTKCGPTTISRTREHQRPRPRETAPDATNATESPNTADAAADNAKQGQEKSKDPAADQEKLDAEWKSKIDLQKSKIADVKREYDLTERESKLSATTYYADAGNRLRDQKDFVDKEASYHDKLANLQKQLADEQAKLSDLQDQAHKAGADKAYE